MDLNDHFAFNQVDQSGMYDSIMALPEQLQKAFKYGQTFDLELKTAPSSVIIAGMGGSAIAADLLIGCLFEQIRVPITVIRGYHLPFWAAETQPLVVCSSHSGNTEETLSVFEDAQIYGCDTIVITTGGMLEENAGKAGVPVWKFDHHGQPRAAVGWSFRLLAAVLEKAGIIPDQSGNFQQAVSEMRTLAEKIAAEVETVKNPAKRYAGQLVGKYVSVFGAEHLSPVARRWKTQVNELAKSWCQYEELPEADHNTLAGVLQPEEQLLKIFSIFLQSPHYHARNQQRVDLTFTELMVAGIGTDKIALRGASQFSDMWLHVLFGDMMAYYLAILYDIDPTPVEAIESLKAQLG